MILVISPKLAGPLATAIAALRKWYVHPDPQARADLIRLQQLLQLTANGGRRDEPFDPDAMVAQAEVMRPLAVTYQEAGRLLSYADSKVRSLVESGELQVIGEGRGARVVLASVEAFAARALTPKGAR